jgi:hypothetical protein
MIRKGESGLARHGSRRQRPPLHRFRCARADPYSFKTRFENEKGTTRGAYCRRAHAGCFTMALAFQLQGGGYTPTELSTEAAVTLDPEGQGFRITRSAFDSARQSAEPGPSHVRCL